jgi:hypothetical protein
MGTLKVSREQVHTDGETMQSWTYSHCSRGIQVEIDVNRGRLPFGLGESNPCLYKNRGTRLELSISFGIKSFPLAPSLGQTSYFSLFLFPAIDCDASPRLKFETLSIWAISNSQVV